jgi:2-polyprenyl-6-hydroxyphenyl methylase/3-demethylubiquinone-9 3-methyltransferase
MSSEQEYVPQSPEPSEKFAFGENWSRYLRSIDEKTIVAAEASLKSLLKVDSLTSRRFLDAGSGSGLFSLAASRLGAEVVSFDSDRDSVACTDHLRDQSPSPSRWFVRKGSLLDKNFLSTLQPADVVYCWGVAHHTGNLWEAIDNLSHLVAPGGSLVLAIYNDQQYVSRLWSGIKRIYQRLPQFVRVIYVFTIWSMLFLRRLGMTIAASLLRLVTLRNPAVPFLNWIRETRSRGMHSWYDLVDWVGGWPFEVARPEEVFRFLRDRGFQLVELTTSGGHGCNEFVFYRPSANESGRGAIAT